MSSKTITTFIISATLLVALLSACARPTSPAYPDRPSASLAAAAPGPQPLISLVAPRTRKPVSATAIESFIVTLTHHGDTDTQVAMSLETTAGASWKAALCYEEFCYMHNGKERLQHTLSLAAGQKRRLEIKMFIPPTASPGEAKTVKLEAAALEDLEATTSVELEGFIP
jgi:hypothetical protein